MFREYLGSSSGATTVCILKLVLIILFRRLPVALVGLELSYKFCIKLLFLLLDCMEMQGQQYINKVNQSRYRPGVAQSVPGS